MANKREGQLGTELSALLQQRNAMVIPYIASEKTPVGIADKRVLHTFANFWLELKVWPNDLSGVQRDWGKMVSAKGDKYVIVYFLEATGVSNETPIKIVMNDGGTRIKQTFDCLHYHAWCIAPAKLLLPIVGAFYGMLDKVGESVKHCLTATESINIKSGKGFFHDCITQASNAIVK